MLWLLIPILLLVLALAALLPGWLRSRSALRDYYSRPLSYTWLEGPAVEPGPRSEEVHREFDGLGYEAVGWLAPESGSVFFRVYVHQELPAYALVAHASDSAGVFAVVPQLESFLPEGGRLSTTTSPDFGRLTGAAVTPGPRLVQLRNAGPGTPTALDGQHLGTLRAWQAGKREFLPASREALLAQLQADHVSMREALAQAGWLPLPEFLRAQAGKPTGVLTF